MRSVVCESAKQICTIVANGSWTPIEPAKAFAVSPVKEIRDLVRRWII